MGFVDRGGSRESKGNSLRRSKKNPGAAAARAAGAKQAIKPPAQPEVPPALAKANKKNDYFDCAAALLSRQFDADVDDVLDRAEQNCAGVVVWSADIDKQQQVLTMSQDNSGLVYAAVGLHPDNVRGTHQREFDKWFQQVDDLSKMRGCVAILSGLNLLRETATHFPQETVLRTMMATAKRNVRPLILHCAPKHLETAERLLVLVEEFASENSGVFPVPVIMHTFLTATNFNSQLVRKFSDLGCYFTVSAAELHSLCGAATTPANVDGHQRTPKQAEEDLAAFVDCLLVGIPPSRVLLASDSPWHTPQTIDDDYIRSQKNEPSNFPNIIEALQLAISTFAKRSESEKEEKSLSSKLKAIVDGNKAASVAVFGIPEKDVEVVASVAIESNPAKGGKGANKLSGGKDGDEIEDDNSGKKKHGGNSKKNVNEQSDNDEEDYGKKNKKKGASKKGKKGVRFDEDSDNDNSDAGGKDKGKKDTGKNSKKGKGSSNNDNDSDDEDRNNNGKSSSAATKREILSGGKKKSGANRDDSDDDNHSDDEQRETSRKSGKRSGMSSTTSHTTNHIHYACLKCRALLFKPSDLIIPEDVTLTNSYFVKVNTANNNASDNNDEEDEEEDENNKYLPPTLRITPNTNGELECRKCSANKLGRAGFKLGVPGFGIKITPSKVESVDTEVSLEELQRKALAEAERYKQEAEAEENATSDDEDGRKGKRTQKKNVKANNKSNFTHFRNKNFTPKGPKGEDIVFKPNGESENDEDDSDDQQQKQKGKRRK